jgi:2-polyprenyl-6-methoxyphenol hydroxylase-like FAD-dependent oxidoreductase
MMSGDVEILRGDLVRLLHERTSPRVAYRFGDSVAAIGADGTVEFERGGTARYHLIVAADGLRSQTRGLVFDDVTMRYQGYRVVGCTIPNLLGLVQSGVTYSLPGRGVCVTSARDPGEARLLFVHRAPALVSRDRETVLREFADAYAGVGWEVPRLLAEVSRAADLYVDDISTVHAPRFARRNVVLLGDAAHGGTLGGQGTAVAMIGAYLLAGELARSPRDLSTAFARYERLLRPYAMRCQVGAKHVGGFFAPRTRPGLWLRDAMYRALTSRSLAGLFERLVTGAAIKLELPDDPRTGAAPSPA